MWQCPLSLPYKTAPGPGSNVDVYIQREREREREGKRATEIQMENRESEHGFEWKMFIQFQCKKQRAFSWHIAAEDWYSSLQWSWFMGHFAQNRKLEIYDISMPKLIGYLDIWTF